MSAVKGSNYILGYKHSPIYFSLGCNEERCAGESDDTITCKYLGRKIFCLRTLLVHAVVHIWRIIRDTHAATKDLVLGIIIDAQSS